MWDVSTATLAKTEAAMLEDTGCELVLTTSKYGTLLYETEFLAGTDPRDSQSVLSAEIRTAPVVSWKSVPGTTYRVLRSTTLTSPNWVPLLPSVTATNSVSVFSDLDVTDQAYYRIEVVE